jgi:hypothetical protein
VIEEHKASADQRVKSFQSQLSEVTHHQKIWNDLITFVRKDWPQHILSLLNREAPFFDKAESENPLVKEALQEIKKNSLEKTESVQNRFPSFLDEACHSSGLPLDRISRDPRYTFENGFFILEIDHKSRMARLSDYEGKLDEFPADIGAIIEAVSREHKRVFAKPFDGKSFLRKIRNQYTAIIKKEKLQDGYAIPIRRITQRLGKNEKGFRTDVFVIQLSRLIEQGPLEIEARRLDLQQTKDTNQGMLLHGDAAELVYSSTMWERTVTFPGAKAFDEKYRKKYNIIPPYHAAQAYAAAYVCWDVLKRTKKLTRDAVREALVTTNMMTIYGPITFKEYQGFKQQTQLPTLLLQVQKKKFEIVWPQDLSTAKYVFPVPKWSERK